MKTRNIFVATIFVLFITSIAFALPQPVGFVNDFANILPQRAELENTLVAYEKNTTIEIAVVTLDSLPQDYTLASYAVELFQQWGIGKKGEDNGILVLIVKNGTVGNRLRIELGYGIQGYITGAESGRILDASMIYYNSGDYERTAEVILQGLFEQLQDYVPGQSSQSSWLDGNIGTIIWAGFFVIMIVISAVYGREKCPNCGSRKLTCDEEFCTCQKCGKKFKRKKRSGFIPIFIGGLGGAGGGFGGFGGGGSGGGGAGR